MKYALLGPATVSRSTFRQLAWRQLEGEMRDEGLDLSLSGNMEGERRDEGLGLSLSGNMEGEMRDEGLGLSLSGKISRLLINVKQRPRHSPPQPADCPGQNKEVFL